MESVVKEDQMAKSRRSTSVRSLCVTSPRQVSQQLGSVLHLMWGTSLKTKHMPIPTTPVNQH